MFQMRSTVRFLVLLALDLLAIYIANYLAMAIRLFIVNYTTYTVPDNLPPILGPFYPSWIWIVFLTISAFQKLYTSTFSFWEESRRIINIAIMSFIIAMSISYIGRWYDLDSRFLVVITSLLYIPTSMTLRGIAKYLMYYIPIFVFRTVVIVDSENAKKILYEVVKKNRSLLVRIRRIIFVRRYDEENLERIKNKISKSKMDLALIYLDNASDEFFAKLISQIHSSIRKTMVIPSTAKMPLLNSEMLFVIDQNVPFISVRNNLLLPINRFLKRTFDIIFSLIVLIFILPVIGLLSLLIVSESPGWPIYKSKRVKKGGKTFYCLKLRSMYADADERLKEILESDPAKKEEWEKYRKLKNDPRVTKIGKVLRKFSLDELPQFINVLLGDMSVVGPRAAFEEEIEKYYREEGKMYYYAVRPGITGLWQVSGRSETDFDFRVRTEIWYVENWSFWLDIVIILKTISVVIKGKGAY
ncbi:MAG: exopolysaccharide biosynthesis polyprenyl glycosylphosphotransferase [Brevinematia bacterium]